MTRLLPVLALAWTLLPTPPAAAQQKFPYTAYILADDVYVRSGPGKNYYPTAKLQSGDAVEVYRHDPGGWYAIRPPEGSYEWVSSRYLGAVEDGIAEVIAAGVAARVGSDFSDIRDVIQVRLHEGELVELIDSSRPVGDDESGAWCKIAPPSGAFRWVHGKYVDATLPAQGIRKVPAGPNPLTDPAAALPEAAAPAELAQATAAEARPIQPADWPVQEADHWAPVGGQPRRADPPPASAPNAGRYTNEFAERARDPDGSVTLRRISPREFQARLDKINVALSAMLVEEPTVWTFHDLEIRAQSLLSEADTAVERGRVRLLLNRIAMSRDIKARYEAMGELESEIDRQERRLASAERRRSEPEVPSADASRYDGAGRLRRVVSTRVGAPQYALIDEAGNVRCFVTPAPGVNMQYYLGRRIGVTGIRGFIPDRGAQHVTAKHVAPLGDGAVVR